MDLLYIRIDTIIYENDTINYVSDIFIYMKFIITENRRNNSITKWLDDNYSDLEWVEFKSLGHSVLYDNRGERIFTIKDGVLNIIEYHLQKDLIIMFGLDEKELNDIFVPWMSEKYGEDITSVKSITWYCGQCGEYHDARGHQY